MTTSIQARFHLDICLNKIKNASLFAVDCRQAPPKNTQRVLGVHLRSCVLAAPLTGLRCVCSHPAIMGLMPEVWREEAAEIMELIKPSSAFIFISYEQFFDALLC